METGTILLIIGFFYFFAQALSLTFRFTRVPDVLILVFIGILIGPIFSIVDVADFGRMGAVVTVIALAIILFESGTSLKLSTMGKSIVPTLTLTFITAITTILVLAVGTVPFLGGDWSLAWLTGVMLCGTSSAVVIPMVQSLKLGEKTSTILVLESALTDVICIVLTFALVESMLAGSVGVFGISLQVVKSLLFAALIGFIGGCFWLGVWNKVREIPSAVFTTIAFAFVLYGTAEIFGVSGAIATLMFGITLANLPVFFHKTNFPTISETESRFYQEIVFLLKTFFFIFLGVSIRINNYTVTIVALVLVLLIYFLRIWITRFCLGEEGVTLRDAIVTSVMIPKGLAPAVLVSLVIQKGILNGESIQPIIFSVIVISITLSAGLIPLGLNTGLKKFYSTILSKHSD